MPSETLPDEVGRVDAGAVVRVFGGMGIDVDGEPISIGGIRQRRLLALLAVRAGTVVSVDWLAEHLWTDDERPTAAVPSVRTYVSRLRSALPDEVRDWIATAPAGYRLDAPAESVEHRRFQLLRADAARATRDGDPQAALRSLDEALALWTGDPFRELEDDVSLRPEIEQLHVDRLEMYEERWQASLELGRHTQITGELAAFTAEHGLRDRAVRQHALALHRSGRTADALAVIAQHRELLADETGLDPSAALLELETQLFAGDPALDTTATGRPLRGYRLLEESGRGAFSVVWRGIQPSVDREVAIKQIRAELASQPDFIRRFEAEAHLVARIEHPHIVPLIDFWRDPDSAYLVMRWMRGGTLERRLDDGWLSVDETLALAGQIGRALAAAHAKGIVHRDVKTANILFDELDNAFLADFGIAMAADGLAAGAAAELSLGTPAYAAPEQIRREQLGPQADVFSLGVVLFECLTGGLPFGELPGPETVERQLHDPFPTLAELRDDVPTHVSDAIERATAKAAADRFPTVLEFVAALGEAPSAPDEAGAPVLDADLPNPYVGLRAFDGGDADRFHGRERLVGELTTRLAGDGPSSRCLVLVGPSGSGKSSVVRAGLVPSLRAGAVPGSADWFTTTMVPGTDPFESLEAALLRVAVDPPASLVEQLRDGHRGILRGVRRCVPDDGVHVLVVIDQFEEVFTNTTPDVTDRFLTALATAADDPQSPLRLVLTVRADHFHRPLGHPSFAALVKQSTVHVTPLAGDELERAITAPAAGIGVGFEPGLVARIAAEAAGRTGSLPLLQYALSELFDRRDGGTLTSEAYDEVGGLTGALASRAEELYERADDDERAATRRLFGRMTHPGEDTADLRRRVRLADVGDDAATRAALERYGRARLLTFDHEVGSREPTVEVAHEALLREWPRLVEWLREDRDLLRATGAIASAAEAWDRAGRSPTDLYRGGRLEDAAALAAASPERLRQVDRDFVEESRAEDRAERDREAGRVRRLRRLVAATASAAVVALVAGSVAVVQQRRADDQATVAAAEAERAQQAADDALAAAEQADLATLISRSAALVGEDDELAVLLALEAHRRSPGPETEAAVLDALSSTTVGARVASHPLPAPGDSPCPPRRADPSGRLLHQVADGELVQLDLTTGQVTGFGPAPAPCVEWSVDAAGERWWAYAFDGGPGRLWTGAIGEQWGDPIDLAPQVFPSQRPLLADGRLLLVEFRQDGGSYSIVDATGALIAEDIATGFPAAEAELSDGSAVLLSTARPGDPGGVGSLVLVDAATGEERWRFSSPLPALGLAVDEAAGEVVAAIEGGPLLTIDLVTGEVLHAVETGTEEIRGLRALDDGLVVAIAIGEYFQLDRTSGRTGVGIALEAPQQPILDVDGRAHAGNRSTIDTYDLAATALAIRSIAVPFGEVAIGRDRATVTTAASPLVTVVDLATGEQTTEELRFPDGSPLVTGSAVHPSADGSLWSLSAFTEVPVAMTQWVDGEAVDRIELHSGVFRAWHGAKVVDDRWVSHVVDDDQTAEVAVATTGDVEQGLRYRVELDEDVLDLVLPDLTLVTVAVEDGTLRIHDATGQLVEEVETGLEAIEAGAVDPAGTRLALTPRIGESGVVLVDLDSAEQTPLSVAPPMASVAWAGDDTLALVGADGAVQLWDVVDDRPLGRLLSAEMSEAQLVDPDTRTMWVARSGEIVQIPLDPDQWLDRACEVVSRDLTQAEWDRWVPGGGDVVPRCSHLG